VSIETAGETLRANGREVKMTENKVKVNIFGNTYTIQGDAPADYIQQLAGFVHDKMADVARNISTGNPTQIAILAALNIADEYFQVRDMKVSLTSDIENKARALISMLDEGLIGDVFSRMHLTQRQ